MVVHEQNPDIDEKMIAGTNEHLILSIITNYATRNLLERKHTRLLSDYQGFCYRSMVVSWHQFSSTSSLACCSSRPL